MTALRQIVSEPASPVPSRSSGTKPTPALTKAAAGAAGSGPRPSTTIVPRSAAQARERFGQLALAVTGHPCDADDLAAARAQVEVADGRQRRGRRGPSAPRRSTPRSPRRRWCACGTAPRRRSSARLSCRRSPRSDRACPRSCPGAYTVIRSAIAITSGSLWEMKTTDRLRRLSVRASDRTKRLVSPGVSTAVGSSRIRTRAPRVKRAQNLEPLACSADRQLPDAAPSCRRRAGSARPSSSARRSQLQPGGGNGRGSLANQRRGSRRRSAPQRALNAGEPRRCRVQTRAWASAA